MTRHRGLSATYDQMMAELQQDSDEDEKSANSNRGRSHQRSSSPPSKRTELSSQGAGKEADPAVARVHTPKGQRSDKRRLSFPRDEITATSRRSSRSRSHISEGEVSDDSDHEHEARVTNANRELFKAADPHTEAAVSGVRMRGEIDALRCFVMRAPVKGTSAIRCYVERDRQGLNRLHPVYRLFLEAGKQFLVCAQKRSSSKTSNYLLTMEQHPTNRRSAINIGKLRGNWSGSEYTVFDDGMSPDKTALEASVRNILASVEFSYDEMGPGQLVAQIPHVQSNGAAATWKDKLLGADSDVAGEKLMVLRNKRPHFDEKKGGHVLDFGGRVNMPSIKNFQMQSDAHGDETILQFGRVSCQPPGPRVQCKCHKNTFTMDVKHPLSPLQGFAVCLATLDTKFTELKLYDNVSKFIKRK